jgi:hypothetical protein
MKLIRLVLSRVIFSDVPATGRPPDDAISVVLDSQSKHHSENLRFQDIGYERSSAKVIDLFSLWHERCKADR